MDYSTDLIKTYKQKIKELRTQFNLILAKYNSGMSAQKTKTHLDRLFKDARMLRYDSNENCVILPILDKLIFEIDTEIRNLEVLLNNHNPNRI